MTRVGFSAQMMRQLLRDLLDLAEVEHGSFKPAYGYFNLAQVVGEAFAIVEQHARQKSIYLRSRVDGDARYFTCLYSDERRYL